MRGDQRGVEGEKTTSRNGTARARAFGRLRVEAFGKTWAKGSASLGNLTGYAAPPLGIYASSEISLSILGHVHSCIRSRLRAFRGGLQVFLRRPRSRK